MATTLRNHLRNYWKEKKYMKWNQSLTIGNEDEDINITSSGKATPFLTHHGNRSTFSPTMATRCHNTRSDTISEHDESSPPTRGTMTYKLGFRTMERTITILSNPLFRSPQKHPSIEMSTSSYNSYSTADSIPSPQELSDIVHDPIMANLIYRRFASKAPTRQLLLHYDFISQTIADLERQLERHQSERENIYDVLFERRSFQTRFRPIVTHYRQRRSRHPYHRSSRSPSPPRSDENFPSRSSSASRSERSVRILLEEATARPMTPPLLQTPESYTLPVENQPGSSRNPILIEESDDEQTCPRCKQHGHQYEDCDVNIPNPFPRYKCDLCDWVGRPPYEECPHVSFPNPAWVKRQQQIIGKREEDE